MDLWQEVSPGCGVWYITREMYMSVCICISNRTSNPVGVELHWSGNPVLDNAVVFAPIWREGRNNNTSISSSKENDEQYGNISIKRFLHPHSTVLVAAVSPADDLAPITLNFSIHVLDEIPPSMPSLTECDESDVKMLEKAAKQTRVVCEWLQERRRVNHSL